MDQDSYEGYTVPAHTGEFLVEMDFFKLESLTYLKGREPEEDDFYVDEDGIRIVPVVIGYQLKDIFDIGDLIYVKKYIDSYPKASLKQKICFSHLYTKGKVVGILDRSNSFLHPSGDTFLWNASLCIIWPDNKSPSPDNYPELRNDEEAYIDVTWNYAFSIPTMKIYINKTNEEQAVAEIRQP